MTLRTSLAALVIVYGAAAQAPYFEHVGTADGQRTGLGVATLGDVNGDGVDDFAATDTLGGAPRCVAYSGFDASVLWTYVGLPLPTAPYTNYTPMPIAGAPIALGDVNADGKGDVVFMDHEVVGSATVSTNVLRCLSGQDGTVVWTATTGNILPYLFPFYGIPTLVGGAAADFDGDGIRDFVARSSNDVLGQPMTDHYLASGANGLPIGGYPNYIGGSTNARPAAVLPDVNGDGYGDYAESTGAPFAVGAVIGFYLGPANTPAGAISNGSMLAQAISSVGDVTGDGVAEVAVSWRALFFGGIAAGDQTVVYLGGAGTVLYTLTRGAAVGAGDDVVPLGDLDGDGFPDFALVGVSTSGVRGYSVRSGPTGTALSTQFFASTGIGVATPPSSVFAAPDVDLDGRPEIAVAEPNVDLGFTNNGRLRIQSFLPPAAAASLDLGGAAGFGGGVLTAAPPVLGMIVAVGATGAAASAAGLLVFDIGPPAVPTPLGGGALHLDLARAATWATFPVAVDAAGAFAFATPIPRVPLLAGLDATAQFAAFGTGAPLGFGLSNGVRVTFGL